MHRRELRPDPDYAFLETVRPLRLGPRDPCFRRLSDGFVSVDRYPSGVATLYVRGGTGRIVGRAWGPGAEEALEGLPKRLGLHEAPWHLPDTNPRVQAMMKAHPGVRLCATGDVFGGLVRTALGQLVTGAEAKSSWRRLVERWGEPAPGPAEACEGMQALPTPKTLASLSDAQLRSVGVGGSQARTLIEVGRRAKRLQEAAAMDTDAAMRRLQALRGIGPWTAASVVGGFLGRPEPVILGDYHLPNTVAWGLAGEERGTEERMLELLAPYEGQAYRVIRLLYAARVQAPKRGPRRQAFASHR